MSDRHYRLVHKDRRDHDRSPSHGHSEKGRNASPKHRVESTVTRVCRAETPKDPERQWTSDPPLSISPAWASLLEAGAKRPAMVAEIGAQSVIADAKNEAQ